MSITLEQFYCNHDFDENYKCKKCEKTDYNALHLRKMRERFKDKNIKYSWFNDETEKIKTVEKKEDLTLKEKLISFFK